MAYTHKISTILANAEPGAGATITTAMHYIGSGCATGLWLHTMVNNSGFASAPGAGVPEIRVALYPSLDASQAKTLRDNPECVAVNRATKGDTAYRWSKYFPVVVPKYFSLGITNTADVAVNSNSLSVAVEYVLEA
jgi:hypothetical protein